ncbi:adhesion G protein-coupled receptor F5 [Lampris incognitus]|uniref:adhesion G protein-coupled receptor F5 n=1 Tax=Lampris incognitus TaxID=2546036 RepID=UPI0024B5161E|nr:adhesion G protein-coupled receptor F5 [Lampris incognitus]
MSTLDNPVPFKSPKIITCWVNEDIGPNVVEWTLTTTDGRVHQITNGTESEITSTGREAKLSLRETSEIWAGLVKCVFAPTSPVANVTLVHTAARNLDVAVLPQIRVSSKPQFPRCKEELAQTVVVTVQCDIGDSLETYQVNWTAEGNKAEVLSAISTNYSYSAKTKVSCKNKDEKKPARITCAFINRRGQNNSATIQINVIYYKPSNFCKAETDWPDTKAGYSARLQCHGSVGERVRKCLANDMWGIEKSHCVDKDLNDILEKTAFLNKGLGTVNENARNVFSRLSAATFNAEQINSYSNLNASVAILFNVEHLKHSLEATILQHLVDSSSNIMNNSLEKLWSTETEGNDTLAEKYLSSVEGLIKLTDMANTETTRMKAENTEVAACELQTLASRCENKVFNSTVSLDSSYLGTVKTAGFQRLANYLPNLHDQMPNSIVVTTTAENHSHHLKVNIKFELIQRRPRHHVIKCVSWDATNKQWSSDGCDWGGPSNEAHCTCNHLSSFATLMSKKPEDIPFDGQLTLIGLFISIISLITCLGMELAVWKTVVKSSGLCLRHTAQVNICLNLLIAHSTLVVSHFWKSPVWCWVFVVLKHFSFLSMFFWMLSLSIVLLHQTVFPFEDLRRKTFLGLSFFLGYAFPVVIVAISIITHMEAKTPYHCIDSCWLTYEGFMKGSIFAFIVPAGIIITFNLFTMVVVTIKLLELSTATISGPQSEKNATKWILKSVVMLTPIFGITWILGFAVLAVDLAYGPITLVIHYAFILLNSFQGFFILLTTCIWDKTVRDALILQVTAKYPSLQSETTSSLAQSVKKK